MNQHNPEIEALQLYQPITKQTKPIQYTVCYQL